MSGYDAEFILKRKTAIEQQRMTLEKQMTDIQLILNDLETEYKFVIEFLKWKNKNDLKLQS